MDVYGAVATAVHEIHVVFVFIKKIVDDVRSYDSDVSDIRARLAHEILFFGQFKLLFFEDANGKRFFQRQNPSIQDDCNQSLTRLSSVLAEYRVQASRHGLDVSSAGTADNDMVGVTERISGLAMDGRQEDWMVDFNARFKMKLSELKRKAVHWSMFDKKNLKEMLEKVRDWMLRLRETVSWMMMTQSFGDLTSLDTDALRDMALGQVLDRQMAARATEPPPDFGPLTGTLDATPLLKGGLGVTAYSENLLGKQLVIYEVREYDDMLKEVAVSGNQEQLREALGPVRQLAWLLHASSFQEGIDVDIPQSGTPSVLGLEFKGYLDLPEDHRTIFIYELPQVPRPWSGTQGSTLTTLYDLINTSSLPDSMPASQQQPLGNRFYIGHALAVTVLNIHTSLWVHKNIRSSVLVMQLVPNGKHPRRTPRPIPFVAGWGVARPANTASLRSADFDVVANIYRHPNRQNQPTIWFEDKHDVYALGVVLVEIGLWKTVDKLFSIDIAQGPLSPYHFVTWWKSPQGRKLMVERMGEAYAETIDFCINMKLNFTDKEGALLRFRNNVVDVLAQGLEL